jgi:hypothetical protein
MTASRLTSDRDYHHVDIVILVMIIAMLFTILPGGESEHRERIEARASAVQLVRDALSTSEEPTVAVIEAAWRDAGVELTYSGDLSISLDEWVADSRDTPRTIVAFLRNSDGDLASIVTAHRRATGTVHAFASSPHESRVFRDNEVAQLIDRAIDRANEEAAAAERLKQLHDGQR